LPDTQGAYNGLVLGYGGVPAAQMEGLVRTLGEVIGELVS
jgi:GntR family transcriptional regulator/MocR family aminotransferase